MAVKDDRSTVRKASNAAGMTIPPKKGVFYRIDDSFIAELSWDRLKQVFTGFYSVRDFHCPRTDSLVIEDAV
jgi:hypothetical protein